MPRASRPLLAVVVGLALLSGCSSGPGPTTPRNAHLGRTAAGTPSALTPAHGLAWLHARRPRLRRPTREARTTSRASTHVRTGAPRHRHRVLHRGSRTASASAPGQGGLRGGRHHRHARSDDRRNSPGRPLRLVRAPRPPWDEAAPRSTPGRRRRVAPMVTPGVYVCAQGNRRASTPCRPLTQLHVH